ncbi:MAG TPA: CPBP family intramembrane metalloprotease [Rubrivivax sp.]|jgi:membrane protease YdiL (CAAX protease family)|nr:CPBP family intramembrane metalloprotease [Rubrivivax sp.]HRY88748.1 CPBP family intramembrane metalloprotease [Rubrivivax sp.]HRZ61604.1 CPBP family intramembrane metalloprotease [Rubrivivax sp.]
MTLALDSNPSLLQRVLHFAPVRLYLLYLILPYLYLAGYFYRQDFAKGTWEGLWATILSCIAMLGMYGVVVHFSERREVTELALRPAARELGLGLLLGFGLYTLCMVVLMLTGSYRILGVNDWHVLISGLSIALATGVFEELLFRAGVFRLAEEWFGTWWALVISSVVFGFTHLDNDAASLQGVISISVWAGALLVGCYLLTRRMWLGIGLHAAWNYTQGSVYSGIVSGNAPPNGFFKATLQGPDWLTGGSFGVEGSVVPFVLCGIVAVWLLVAAKRRGHIMPPLWKRKG